MGSYAAYVIPAWALTLLALALIAGLSWRSYDRQRKALEKLEAASKGPLKQK